jgi:hypothetical protein
MTSKHRLLFWLDGFFMHYLLAYYLQSQLDADFFAITDINSKPKKFFENQKLVNFQKNWYYHDHINLNEKKPDIEYLINFEKKYNINLWKLALNERYFYIHNRFYKFEKEEILLILEQELKLFETILDEIKPDYFLTYNPVLHNQKLLLDLCKSKGIKVLNACRTGIGDQTVIVEDGETFDLDLDKNINDFDIEIHQNKNNNDYDLDQKNWIKGRNVSFSDKLSGFKNYLFDSDSDLIKSNYMYFGRSKLKVIKDTLWVEYKRKTNYNFLNKFSILDPSLNIPFVYFPMNITEEASLLHYAPFFTNQLEVIRHISKSIPIDHLLYVKEHVAAGLRFWNHIDYYKEILELPNVKLIHPKFDNNVLIKNSKLVITLRGTSNLKAVEFSKPTITFGKQPYQIIPSVYGVESLNSLPELIKTALKSKIEPLDCKKFESLFKSNDYVFPINVYEVIRNQYLFSGNGVYSNIDISDNTMLEFLEKNKQLFSEGVKAHLKVISSDKNLNNEI